MRFGCNRSKKNNLPGTKTPSGGEVEAVTIVILNENLRSSWASLEDDLYRAKLL